MHSSSLPSLHRVARTETCEISSCKEECNQGLTCFPFLFHLISYLIVVGSSLDAYPLFLEGTLVNSCCLEWIRPFVHLTTQTSHNAFNKKTGYQILTFDQIAFGLMTFVNMAFGRKALPWSHGTLMAWHPSLLHGLLSHGASWSQCLRLHANHFRGYWHFLNT